MCGFVSLVTTKDQCNIWELGQSALETISHRGPDDRDEIVVNASGNSVQLGEAGMVYLGHRRLSILDLSPAGRQPMRCRETGNLIVFNGEIYNFLELRQDLKSLGYTFRTESDTEVVLQAYMTWGSKAFIRFNGMWAMAIYEHKSGDIILSRDRLGVKPLYMSRTPKFAVFGSEIRSIISVLGETPGPDEESLFDFLLLGISDHTCRTFFSGISQIPAGSVVRLSRNGVLQTSYYHQWPAPDSGIPDHEALRHLVIDSVLLRMRSDAPTVSLLSGGLDSSIITWISSVKGRGESRSNYCGAYTYGYEEENSSEHDETWAAQDFINKLDPAPSHFVHLARAVPSEADLYELTTCLEEPPSTPSTLAGLRLYRAIRNDGFKVALVGEGADELFGGYTRAYMSRLVRDHLKNCNLSAAIKVLASGQVSTQIVLNRLIWELPATAISTLLRRYRPNARSMSETFWYSMRDRFSELCQDRRLPLNERLRLDVTTTNLPMILRYSDRNSMKWGVEARSPFLDYRLVSLAMSLPLSEKVGYHGGKILLRKAFDGLLPHDTVWKPKTHGFGNAEQFQLPFIDFRELWEGLPA
jgi:asparagine synthase (glutamine-hydrolysing)